jgi:hypothetical protein
MLPKEFKPKFSYDLIRLGKNDDGGYLIEKSSLVKSNGLVSFGLGLDWSFEQDFFKYNNCPIEVYDHTIRYSSLKKFSRNTLINFFSSKNWNKKNINILLNNLFIFYNYKKFFTGTVKHLRESIGLGNKSIRLEQILKKFKYHPIFLKVDIEGCEYRILDEIINFQKYFSGLVIEFHNIDLHKEKIITFINNLNLDLVHIHGQNAEYLDLNNDPIQVEMTFSKNPKIISNSPVLPHKFDKPGNPNFDEIVLNFDD